MLRLLLRLLLLLSASGISSAVERSLLASTQQRQSPANPSLVGFTNFVLDGVKLFGKILTTNVVAYGTIFASVLLFVVAVLTDVQLEVARIVSPFLAQLTAWALCTLVEIFAMALMASVQTPYVLLSFQRNVEMIVVSELVWNLVTFIAFASHVPTRSCSLVRNAGSLLLLVLTWNFLMVTIEKVPFDIVEAESELIDGVTTEFAGYAFSLVYAAEVTTGFLVLKFFLGNAGFVIVPVFLAILGLFYGRAFLARILMVDLLEHAFSVGLILTVVLLTVGTCWRC